MATKTPESAFHVKQVDLAKILGRSQQTIITWTQKHGLPQGDGGKYFLPDVMAWYSKWMVRDFNEISETLEQSKARLTSVQADLAEMDLKERRGILIDAAEHSEIVFDVALRLKTRLESFFRKMEYECVGLTKKEAQELAESERVNLFKELQSLFDKE